MNFRKFLFSPQRTVPHAIWGLDPKDVRAALRDRGARVRSWHRVKTGSLSFLIDADAEDIARFGPHGTANRLTSSMQYWLEMQGCGETVGAIVVPEVATRVDDVPEDSPRMSVYVTRHDESDAGEILMAVARDRRRARVAARKELGESARSVILKALAEADPKARLARYGYHPAEAGAAPDTINHEKYYRLTQPVSFYGGYLQPRYEYKALRVLVSGYRRHNGVRVGIGIAFSDGSPSGANLGSAYFDSPSDWNTVMNGVIDQLHVGISKIVAMSPTNADWVESHALWLLKEIQRVYDPSLAIP